METKIAPISERLVIQTGVKLQVSNYDDVILTDDEASEALRLARKRKYALLEEQAYWAKVNKPKEYQKFDTAGLREKVLSQNPDYIIDESNEEIFNTLCAYFSGDPDCETFFNVSLKKGIMLYGPVGCGKTSLMRMFADNSFRPFVVNAVRVISDEYTLKDMAIPTLIKYSTLAQCYANDNYGHTEAGRCFDDLGTEDIKKNFGNESNVIQDVLYKIYDNRLIGHFHGTTNLTGDEIEAAYGTRIRSRMREMFNVINFSQESPDRRS